MKVEQNHKADKGDLSNMRIAIADHTTFAWGPEELLAIYLRNCTEVLFIHHPFDYMTNHPSCYEIFRSGIKQEERKIGSTYSPTISYVKDLIVTVYVVLKQKQKYDLFVGVDPLNALAGLFLKTIGKTDKVIFYPIDYTPQRFKNRFMNFVYHSVEMYCATHCDNLWAVARNIVGVFLSKGIDKEKCHFTPSPIEKIYENNNDKLRNPVIGYLGSLHTEKGVQLIIEAMPSILKSNPNTTLLVIGGGPLENDLRALAKKLGVEKHVKLTGRVPIHRDAMEMLSNCTIAAAPYVPSKNSYSEFAFGGKISEYYACGLPIVITRVPESWKEIEARSAGVIIDYDVKDFVAAINKLLADKAFYEKCRAAVYALAYEYHYKTVFDNAFARMNLHLG